VCGDLSSGKGFTKYELIYEYDDVIIRTETLRRDPTKDELERKVVGLVFISGNLQERFYPTFLMEFYL